MYFKKMIGKKCYLSPIDVNDADKFTEWLNDLDVLENLIYDFITNVENERSILDHQSKEHNYSIVTIENNELIGKCCIEKIDNLNQTAEVGIFIGNKNYWNKGYGTEAMTLLLDYGFKALNLHNIIIEVYSFNKRALRAYEKVGFKQIGKRREAAHRNLKKHDIIFMDLLVNEFYDKNKME